MLGAISCARSGERQFVVAPLLRLFRELCLQRHRAGYRLYGGREVRKEAVAHGLEQPTAVLSQQWLQHVRPQRSEA